MQKLQDGSTIGTSLSQSIYNYRVENGRTYHSFKVDAGVTYICPNDEVENDRLGKANTFLSIFAIVCPRYVLVLTCKHILDLQHHLALMTLGGKLHMAPVGKDGHKLHRVLDVGTGTGLWAMDIGEEHPEASVIGIDLSPIQPTIVVPNVQFYVDNLDEDWAFDHPFDFVHMRFMLGSVKDWPKWIRQAYLNLNPGGFVELCDPINPIVCDDGSVPADSALLQWNNLLLEASEKLGAPMNCALHYKRQLEEAGFTNVVQHEFKWPINTWPRAQHYKTLGAWSHRNIMEGLEGVSLMLFTNVLGWSAEAVQLFLVQVRKDLANRSYHGYWRV